MIIENIPTLKINKLTQAQYERELTAGNIDENQLYLTPYEEVDLSGYDTAIANLQTALDEIEEITSEDIISLFNS